MLDLLSKGEWLILEPLTNKFKLVIFTLRHLHSPIPLLSWQIPSLLDHLLHKPIPTYYSAYA